MPANQTPKDGINPPERLSTVCRGVRLYQDDDRALSEIKSSVEGIVEISIVNLIRDCVRLGLPKIEERWASLVREGKMEKEKGK